MAPKKTPNTQDDTLIPLGNDSDLDQAIDDLRGVLKGDIPDSLNEFGGDFDASPLPEPDIETSFMDSPLPGGGIGGLDNDFGGDFGGSASNGSGFQTAGSALNANLDLIMDIPIDVEIVLGSSRMPVSGLMSLEEGATIALDKKIGEPVEIMVNGRRIGKGEITVLDDDDTRFGVKLTEVMSTRKI